MEIRNLGDKYYVDLRSQIAIAIKIRPVHVVKRNGTLRNEEISHDLERPLEVPKVGDMFCSTPASEYLCHRDLPRAQEWCQLMLQQSKENYGSSGKSAHDSLDIDTHYNVIKDVYVPEELKRPHTYVNTVSVNNREMTTPGQMLILRWNHKSEIENSYKNSQNKMQHKHSP